MSVFQAIILGIIQGLTEFLPISSSAHLLFARWIMGWGEGMTERQELTFDVALHAGTLLAIVLYFRRDLLALIAGIMASLRDRDVNSEPNRRLAWFIVLATLPAALFGYFGERAIEEHLRVPALASAAMILLALFLLLAERTGRRAVELKKITLRDSLIIGLAQTLALVPGVSRSGVTITAGLFCGLTREAAARFSFLLGAPITAGAVVFKVGELLHQGVAESERLPFIFGILSSGLVGLLSIWFLLRYLRTHTTHIFIWYRVVLGGLLLGLLFLGVLDPRL